MEKYAASTMHFMRLLGIEPSGEFAKLKASRGLNRFCCICGTSRHMRGGYHLLPYSIFTLSGRNPYVCDELSCHNAVCEGHRTLHRLYASHEVDELSISTKDKEAYKHMRVKYETEIEHWEKLRKDLVKKYGKCQICGEPLLEDLSSIQIVDYFKPLTEDNLLLTCNKKGCCEKSIFNMSRSSKKFNSMKEQLLSYLHGYFLSEDGSKLWCCHLTSSSSPEPYYRKAKEFGYGCYFAVQPEFVEYPHQYKDYTYCHTYSFDIDEFAKDMEPLFNHSILDTEDLWQSMVKLGAQVLPGFSTIMSMCGGQLICTNDFSYAKYFSYLDSKVIIDIEDIMSLVPEGFKRYEDKVLWTKNGRIEN